MDALVETERTGTVVIGAGQAGLSVGYHLAKADRPFVILDAHERIGDSWRKRWDSLRAFTQAGISSLPGWPIPAPAWSFPTKDQLADYFEAYASRFELPIRTGVTVTRVARDGDRFVVAYGDRLMETDNVVVASGHEHTPCVPRFATELDPKVMQLHSSEYRRPSQLVAGDTLVVGAGNSGAEIALEVSRTHHTWLSGQFRRAAIGPSRNRLLTVAVLPIVSHVLTIDTPIGRKVRPKMSRVSVPVERVTAKALAEAGVVHVPRTVGVRDGSPALEDGRSLDVANVIWCTGYRPQFAWIDMPIFAQDGEPMQERGIVPGVPGLYFVGRRFQYAFTSNLLVGVARDAAYVVKQIVARTSVRDAARTANAGHMARST
jgi:putative flavoprotein involved in K+ transport